MFSATCDWFCTNGSHMICLCFQKTTLCIQLCLSRNWGLATLCCTKHYFIAACQHVTTEIMPQGQFGAAIWFYIRRKSWIFQDVYWTLRPIMVLNNVVYYGIKHCRLLCYFLSEGQHRWESLERKHERQDWDGMDTFGGKMMGILGEGCWGWSCQERGNGEGQKGGLWMWWKRTWLRLKWRRRIQLIGETGERKSAVATPDGKSRKKKKKCYFLWRQNCRTKQNRYICHTTWCFGGSLMIIRFTDYLFLQFLLFPSFHCSCCSLLPTANVPVFQTGYFHSYYVRLRTHPG